MLYISCLETLAHNVYYVNPKMVYLVYVTDSETGDTIKYGGLHDNMYRRMDKDYGNLYDESIFSNVYGYVAGKGFWRIDISDLDIYKLLDFDMELPNTGTKSTRSSISGVVDDSSTLFSTQMHITNNLFTLGALIRSGRNDLYEIKGNKLVVKTDNFYHDLQYTILDVTKFNRLITKIKVLCR